MSDQPKNEPLGGALCEALRIAEARHIDNTGMECDVRSHRDDCCQYCAAALHIRMALRELGVNAYWRNGKTVLLTDEEAYEADNPPWRPRGD